MKLLLIWTIRGYQKMISRYTPPSCRFHPTCSTYGLIAIQRHGIVRGMGLTVWRILRCNPFGGSGHDPVPDVKNTK